MDCSPPGFSVHGISQARILEWVAISFSMESSQPRDWTRVSCIGRRILYHWATREDWERRVSSVQSLSTVQLFATLWTAAHQASLSITNSWSLLKQWCHPIISSSVIPFSCLQSLPVSGSFPMSQFFTSGGQNIGEKGRVHKMQSLKYSGT